MKIKTQKEQIREEIVNLDSIIDWNSKLEQWAYKKWQRRENWMMLSFISDTVSSLRFKYEHLQKTNKVLSDYRESLHRRLMSAKD